MIFPPYLHPGDCIGIVAPARKISINVVKPAINFLVKNGFRVVLGQTIGSQHFQFSATDEERAADVQSFMDDPDIQAIWCACGGYGSVRIIDKLDFSHFKERPKWFCGFSDVTVFHSHLHNLGIASLHCTMPVKIDASNLESVNNRSMIQGLNGGILAYSVPACSLNKQGMASGEVVGGNLSVLYSLLASPSDLNTTGKILLIEDLDEHLYHVDRMMQALKRSGKLDNLAGLIVGTMDDMHNKDAENPFGQTAEEIIDSCCAGFSYPICYNFPVGHGADNVAVKMGARASLSVSANGGALIFNE